jgi:hypothetical protein
MSTRPGRTETPTAQMPARPGSTSPLTGRMAGAREWSARLTADSNTWSGECRAITDDVSRPRARGDRVTHDSHALPTPCTTRPRAWRSLATTCRSSPSASPLLPSRCQPQRLVSKSLLFSDRESPSTSHLSPTMLTTLPLHARPPPRRRTPPPATCSRRPTTVPSHSATATDAHGGLRLFPRPFTKTEEI